MKIEKISDTQIRCTLNRADLVSRELKISELAYGTEKAKLLFHDMIEQASNEFGFEADDIPLMIEAIPMSADCIVLIITKVDDPDELDAKLSRFAPVDELEDGYGYTDETGALMELDDISDVISEAAIPGDHVPASDNDGFIPMVETIAEKAQENALHSTPEVATRVYSFDSWQRASDAVSNSGTEFEGVSRLYHNASTGTYYLVLTGILDDKSDIFRICNLLSEYGHKEKTNYATLSYLKEHCRIIIKNDALKILTEY